MRCINRRQAKIIIRDPHLLSDLVTILGVPNIKCLVWRPFTVVPSNSHVLHVSLIQDVTLDLLTVESSSIFLHAVSALLSVPCALQMPNYICKKMHHFLSIVSPAMVHTMPYYMPLCYFLFDLLFVQMPY